MLDQNQIDILLAKASRIDLIFDYLEDPCNVANPGPGFTKDASATAITYGGNENAYAVNETVYAVDYGGNTNANAVADYGSADSVAISYPYPTTSTMPQTIKRQAIPAFTRTSPPHRSEVLSKVDEELEKILVKIDRIEKLLRTR